MRTTRFPEEVEKLALNLYNIVRDTAQVKANEYDVIMLVRECSWDDDDDSDDDSCPMILMMMLLLDPLD